MSNVGLPASVEINIGAKCFTRHSRAFNVPIEENDEAYKKQQQQTTTSSSIRNPMHHILYGMALPPGPPASPW